MDRVLELLEQFFKQQWIFIVLLVLLIVSIILLYRKNKKVKALESEIEMLEVDFNTIKSMPLTFKLNKARSLSKVNDLIEDEIKEYINSYETSQKAIERITNLFASAEDNISLDNLSEASQDVDEISQLTELTLKNVETLNEKLDDILQQELQLRSNVLDLKERFRQIKKSLSDNSGLLSFSEEVIDGYVVNVENEFAAFDEWMYISEFSKAEASLEKIENNLKHLDEILQELPELLPVAKEIIPNKIADVSSLYSQVRNADVYLDHLGVTQSLTTISKNLSGDLANLRSGDVEKVKTSLDASNQNLDELKEKLNYELSSQKQLVESSKNIAEKIKSSSNDLEVINLSIKEIEKNYEVSNFKEKQKDLKSRYEELLSDYKALQDSFDKNSPATSMLKDLEKYQKSLSELFSEINELKVNVNKLLEDSKRAQQQLLKLHLIINEVQNKINEYRLPSISSEYKEDVKLAKEHTRNIENLLNDKNLDLNLLNSTLDESIDYVYTLYNNVNNIVGMAIMVENALVFANRYRSTYPEVDSELTKTELYFRNGEYTQSLTTVLSVIEKIHPENYEELIRENATNVI